MGGRGGFSTLIRRMLKRARLIRSNVNARSGQAHPIQRPNSIRMSRRRRLAATKNPLSLCRRKPPWFNERDEMHAIGTQILPSSIERERRERAARELTVGRRQLVARTSVNERQCEIVQTRTVPDQQTVCACSGRAQRYSRSPDCVVRILPGIPMARIGTPEEVADVILWLLSDELSYVAGAIVRVSGGR